MTTFPPIDWGRTVARCEVVKYTVCVEHGQGGQDCDVRKHVKCHEVCKAIGYTKATGKYQYNTTSQHHKKRFPEMCQHATYGPFACMRVVQME